LTVQADAGSQGAAAEVIRWRRLLDIKGFDQRTARLDAFAV
jgi:hypothetical protein